MRFWLIKTLNAARLAEQLLRLAAAKTVAGEVIFPREKREAFVRNEEVQIA